MARGAVASGMDSDEFDCFVATVYDTVLDPQQWTRVLRELANALRCHFAGCVVMSEDRMHARSLGVFGITPEDHRDFLTTWARNSVWGSRRPVRRGGDVTLARDILPRAEFEHSDIYRSYYGPRQIEEGLRLDLLRAEGSAQTVSLCRPWSAGLFEPAEIRLARRLVPHLQRAATLGLRLQRIDARAQSALDALDVLKLPVLLLDRTCRIVHASTSAEALLREDDGLSSIGSGLTAATPPLSAQLEALVARAARGDHPVGGALRLPRPSGRPSLSLLAAPVGKGHDWMISGQPAVLLYVNPLAGPVPTAEWLMGHFNLTRAEASLAGDLLRGASVGEIASGTGRSVPTVRTHLARLMAKTRTSRQSDLIRVLMGLPPYAPPTGSSSAAAAAALTPGRNRPV